MIEPSGTCLRRRSRWPTSHAARASPRACSARRSSRSTPRATGCFAIGRGCARCSSPASASCAVVDTLQVDPTLFACAARRARSREESCTTPPSTRACWRPTASPLGNVFDTAIAARFLGFAATGLASLLAQLFEVQLPKHMQQADWGERPLSRRGHRLPRKRRALSARAARAVARARARRGHRARGCARSAPTCWPRRGAASPSRRRSRASRARSHVRRTSARGCSSWPGCATASRASSTCRPRVWCPTTCLLRFGELESPSVDELERRLPRRYRAYAPRLRAALAQAEGRDDAPRRGAGRGAVSRLRRSEVARRKRRRELLTSFRAREAERAASISRWCCQATASTSWSSSSSSRARRC